VITVTNLVKYHGTHRVLDGVSLEVKQGEVTALVGPSGGGKSTLLRCINGLETFHDGEVNVAGLLLTGNSGRPHPNQLLVDLRRTVGMVFQQFNLFPHMTALENVMSGPLFALRRPRAEAEELARDLLNRVGLSHKLFAKPGQLSGGQQQRVAIARALAVNPRAILFDEPTSALDPRMAAEVLAVMRDLAREGQTMIVVSHDMDLVRQATIAHKMEAGRIVKSGPPSDVLREDPEPQRGTITHEP
jgi:ABC-type polar amino acid transport system ATPase subunit